jgi:hypothetical protein
VPDVAAFQPDDLCLVDVDGCSEAPDGDSSRLAVGLEISAEFLGVLFVHI